MKLKLKDIANLVAGELRGDPDIEIIGVAGMENAGPGEITFAADARRAKKAVSSRASAAIVPTEAPSGSIPTVHVADPRLAFTKILEAFAPKIEFPAGIHPSAVIAKGVELGEGVSIGPHVTVEEGVRIGRNVTIFHGVYVGHESVVGEGSVIYPNVVIRERVIIGKNVILHPGVVIGADGFGFIQVDGRHRKVPQIGRVIIEDDVEIGANSCVDRATMGFTMIKRGTKIDNLVQVAHNAVIGEDVVIAGLSGMGGSTTIHDRVTLGGMVGIMDHLTIGRDTVVGAKSAVMNNVPPNSFISGSPARPHKEDLACERARRKLPELLKVVADLERRIEEVEGR